MANNTTNNNTTNNTNTEKKLTKNGKAFNPTVTALFANDKFGEGSLLSANLDAEGFANIQRHVQIGTKFVIKKSPRLSKSGNVTYFMEILPPLSTEDNIRRARNTSGNDDI